MVVRSDYKRLCRSESLTRSRRLGKRYCNR